MKTKIVVTCPETIFGVIVKIFDTDTEALKWIAVCITNDVKITVEIR